jgi:hypothetical protein
MSEDITNTNHNIYNILRNLMNKPEHRPDLKTFISSLHDKVSKMKSLENQMGNELNLLHLENEMAETPDSTPIEKNAPITPEEEKHNEILEKLTNTPQPPADMADEPKVKPTKSQRKIRDKKPPIEKKKSMVRKPLRELQDKVDTTQKN